MTVYQIINQYKEKEDRSSMIDIFNRDLHSEIDFLVDDLSALADILEEVAELLSIKTEKSVRTALKVSRTLQGEMRHYKRNFNTISDNLK